MSSTTELKAYVKRRLQTYPVFNISKLKCCVICHKWKCFIYVTPFYSLHVIYSSVQPYEEGILIIAIYI